jgi:hypothetical protein
MIWAAYTCVAAKDRDQGDHAERQEPGQSHGVDIRSHRYVCKHESHMFYRVSSSRDEKYTLIPVLTYIYRRGDLDVDDRRPQGPAGGGRRGCRRRRPGQLPANDELRSLPAEEVWPRRDIDGGGSQRQEERGEKRGEERGEDAPVQLPQLPLLPPPGATADGGSLRGAIIEQLLHHVILVQIKFVNITVSHVRILRFFKHILPLFLNCCNKDKE